MHPTCDEADDYSSSNAAQAAHCTVVQVGERVPGVSDYRSVEDNGTCESSSYNSQGLRGQVTIHGDLEDC